ncbi:MAG: hypothetical protein M3Q57_06730 [Pseudomonadota bacterium]|nr:hypothetical protein [Pseudomonadota bacterium]
MNRRSQILRLSLREYLPLILTIALWGVIVLMIGHADTVRLLAATVAVRAVQMLTRFSTPVSLKARSGAPRPIRRQAKRFALAVQLAMLAANVALVVLLVLALDAIGQREIAMFLPLIAIGLPARTLRNSDTRTNSPYFRLAMAGGGLAAVAAGWLADLGPVGAALAFGAREWIAYVVVRWWPKAPHVPERPIDAPLGFAEVARNTATSGRRLLTYRISKVALTLFGPAGNVAARTGRGMGWHRKAEPYLPHRLSGFVLFALAAAGGALFLAVRSGEPLAMVGAAGLLQLCAVAANIAMLWRYLPDREDPNLVVDEDDED